MNKKYASIAIVGYISAVILANWLSTNYGLVAIGFGLTASAGTYAAGAALGLRDLTQNWAGRAVAVGAMLAAAVLSYAISSPAIATASALAFLCSETADFLVYTPLRRRGFGRAVLASTLVGGLVDTLVFLHVSGFGVTLRSVEGQMVGKFLWASLVPVALVAVVRKIRARA